MKSSVPKQSFFHRLDDVFVGLVALKENRWVKTIGDRPAAQKGLAVLK